LLEATCHIESKKSEEEAVVIPSRMEGGDVKAPLPDRRWEAG